MGALGIFLVILYDVTGSDAYLDNIVEQVAVISDGDALAVLRKFSEKRGLTLSSGEPEYFDPAFIHGWTMAKKSAAHHYCRRGSELDKMRIVVAELKTEVIQAAR